MVPRRWRSITRLRPRVSVITDLGKASPPNRGQVTVSERRPQQCDVVETKRNLNYAATSAQTARKRPRFQHAFAFRLHERTSRLGADPPATGKAFRKYSRDTYSSSGGFSVRALAAGASDCEGSKSPRRNFHRGGTRSLQRRSLLTSRRAMTANLRCEKS